MREFKMKFFGCCLAFLLAARAFSGSLGLNDSSNAFIVPPVQFNVAAEGMGNAGVADGTLYNGSVLNPAVLANAPHFGEITLGLSASNDIITIANYLTNNNNITNLQKALTNLGPSIQEIVQNLENQSTLNVPEVNQGLVTIQNGITNLQTAAATLTDKTIQLGAAFNIALKFDDHWGFQAYNNTHAVFQINRGSVVTDLENMSALPATLQGSTPQNIYNAANAYFADIKSVLETAFPNQAVTLGNAVTNLGNNLTSQGVSQFTNTLSTITSSINQTEFQKAILNDVLEVTGLAYTDTVAMVTYSFNPLAEETPLTVGASFKVVNRRIGYVNSAWLSGLDLSDFSNVSNQLKNDINQSTFRWGLDLGLLYDFQETGISIGASALDLLHSSATINTSPGDPLYGIVTDPAPTVIALGASWHLCRQLTLNADLDDLFSSTSYYQGMDITSHAKLGASYNLLGVFILRGGVSNSDLSGGLGIPILGLDYAYAKDDLTQSYNHYLCYQTKL